MSPLATRTVTSSDGTLIYAEASGAVGKPSIVFVHGLQLSCAVFDDLCADPRLSSQFYLVRMDMRGHGRSGKPETAEGHASHLYAADFKAVIDAFSLTKPLFVGWSLGATIAADIAAALNPLPVSGLVFMSALPYMELAGVVGKPTILGFLPGMMSTDDVALAKKTALDFVDSAFVDPASVPFTLKASWAGMSAMQPPAVTALILARTQDPAALHVAGRNGLPLLILHGAADAQVDGAEVARQLRPHFADCEVQIVPGGSHALFHEKRDEVVQHLTAFAHRCFGAAPARGGKVHAGAMGAFVKGVSAHIHDRLVSTF